MRSSIPWPNITTATLIALSISKFAHAERDVPTGWAVANTNAQCDKPVRITDPNIDRPLGWFATDRGYPVCRVYSSKDGLPGAESKSGTGYDVYWDIGQPDDGCEIIIMSPVGQDVPGSNCGNVILTAKDAKCYYTHLDTTFMIQFCCGSDDCAAATNGASDKRSLDAIMKRGNMKMDVTERDTNSTLEPLETFTLEEKWAHQAATNPPGRSLTARASSWAASKVNHGDDSTAALGKREGVTCGAPIEKGDWYTKAGPQTQLTNTLQCTTNEACSQTITKTIAVSHSLTNEKSFTWSLGSSLSVAIEAGVDFIIEAKATGTIAAELSFAIGESTSETDTTTEMTTLHQTFSQPPGTNGYIWFTPTLNCQRMKVKCNDKWIRMEKCDPKTLATGDPAGDLGFTTTG